MPRPSLGRSDLHVRLTPATRAALGPRPSERARKLLEAWAAEQIARVTRHDLESLLEACAATDDGEGVELVANALGGDEGSLAWCRAAELYLRLHEDDGEKGLEIFPPCPLCSGPSRAGRACPGYVCTDCGAMFRHRDASTPEGLPAEVEEDSAAKLGPGQLEADRRGDDDPDAQR